MMQTFWISKQKHSSLRNYIKWKPTQQTTKWFKRIRYEKTATNIVFCILFFDKNKQVYFQGNIKVDWLLIALS